MIRITGPTSYFMSLGAEVIIISTASDGRYHITSIDTLTRKAFDWVKSYSILSEAMNAMDEIGFMTIEYKP